MCAVLISLLLGAASIVGCGHNAKPPDFERMPHRLGLWEGKNTKVPPEILAAVGADVIINRIYRNLENEVIQIPAHLAVFSDWETGMRHNPMVVYKAAGWKLLTQTHEPVSTSYGKNIRVSLSEWEKDYDKIVVLFWYQLGDHILFNRPELDQISSELHDQNKPVHLVKVQLQINESRAEGANSLDTQQTLTIAYSFHSPNGYAKMGIEPCFLPRKERRGDHSYHN